MITIQKLRQIVRNVLVEHEMSLDTLIKPLVTGDDACLDCKGTGKYVPAYGAAENCRLCAGSGKKQVQQTNTSSHDVDSIISSSQDDLGDEWNHAYDWIAEHADENDLDYFDSSVAITDTIFEFYKLDVTDEAFYEEVREVVMSELDNYLDLQTNYREDDD